MIIILGICRCIKFKISCLFLDIVQSFLTISIYFNISLLQITSTPSHPVYKRIRSVIIRIKFEKHNHPQLLYNHMEHNFNFEDSNELLMPVNWLPRQKSNDSIFAQLIRVPSYPQRDLIISYKPADNSHEQYNKVFKPREKKTKIKKPCDYRKNICGYITKKIIREYLSPTYHSKTQQLCLKYGCDYQTSKSYYLSKIQHITGPSHVPSLFIANEEWQKPIKQAFRQFFIWFTKQRYLRYLILEGKMQQKQAYIQYKNTILMSIVAKTLDSQHDFSALSQEQSDDSSK